MQRMKFNKEYALTGATLIDGNGKSPVENAVIVVEDGIIESVGGRWLERSRCTFRSR